MNMISCFLLFSVFRYVGDFKRDSPGKKNGKENLSTGNGKRVNCLFLVGLPVFKQPAYT